MTEALFSALIFVFETLSCFFFFENYCSRKIKLGPCSLCYAAAFCVLFGVSLAEIPIVNLIAFILCYFAVSLVCYEIRLKNAAFSALLLATVMLITETITVYSLSAINKTAYTLYKDDLLTFAVQSSLSKLFFFLLLFVLAKIFNLKANRTKANKFTLLLGILPLSSVIVIHSLVYAGSTATPQHNTLLAICSVLLLFANFFVFWVYETVQRTNLENTQLRLEKQRNEVSRELYEEMSLALESSRILAHDVKNHFSSIYDISEENNYTKVKDYVKSIYDNFGVNRKITYSGNKMVDVILNRYVSKCEADGVFFEIESCCSDLSFMNDTDVVSLITNMLDNAVDSALRSQKKEILFSIYVRNDSFVIIQISNSCDKKPLSINGRLLTLKKDSSTHGVGTQSIRRVVERYDGSFLWDYNEETHVFTTSALLKR